MRNSTDVAGVPVGRPASSVTLFEAPTAPFNSSGHVTPELTWLVSVPQSRERAGKDPRDLPAGFVHSSHLHSYLRSVGLRCPRAADRSLRHKRQTQQKLTNGNKETTGRPSTAKPALPRAHKAAAQGSGQLQLYKVTQIFYLETAKPILLSSVFINNPVGCCYQAYKQRGV